MQEFTMHMPVYFSDSDATGRMSPVSVMRAMIESSMQHSKTAEEDTFSHSWVLYQWDIDFHDFPKPGTRLTATTWTTGFYKFYAYRHFRLEEEGRPIAQARTTWLLLGGESNRPIRVPPDIARWYGTRLLERQPVTIKEADDFSVKEKEKIRVRSYHIDTNQHVNNLVYADWILEALPVDFRTRYELKKMILTYRKQILYPETVISAISQPAIITHHRVLDTQGDVRAWGRTVWREKETAPPVG